MAFSSRDTTERPPLRHLDLDALSDRELEALLFDGSLPRKRRSWWPPTPVWIGFGAVGVVLLAVLGPGIGAISGGSALMMIVAALLFFAFKNSSSCSSSARSTTSRRWTRSTSDRKLMGVCGGLAECSDVDSTIVRFSFILGLLVTGGPPMGLAYLLLAYLLPNAPTTTQKERLRIIRES